MMTQRAFFALWGRFEWAIFAQICPLGVVKNGKKENLLLHQKSACNSYFCEPNFQELEMMT